MTTVRKRQWFRLDLHHRGGTRVLHLGLSMEADLSRAARIFGLFPVNLLHNLVHLAFGIWGVAARKFSSARTYCRAAG